MARYSISVSSTAERQLRRLPRSDLGEVVEAIERLATEPRPRGSRKLVGYDDVFRIRVGPYRVLYSVDDRAVIVIILKVGNRRDLYR